MRDAIRQSTLVALPWSNVIINLALDMPTYFTPKAYSGSDDMSAFQVIACTMEHWALGPHYSFHRS